MDSYYKILVFILLSFGLKAQVPTQLNALYSIGTTSSIVGGYQISGTMNDLNGVYYPALVQIGDVVWDSKCDRYTITQIISTVPNLIVNVSGSALPNTSIGLIYRPTINNSYPLITVGLPEKLSVCVLNERMMQIDNSSGNGIVLHGIYNSDEDAAANGCPINAYYEVAFPNKMGIKPGTIVKRKN